METLRIDGYLTLSLLTLEPPDWWNMWNPWRWPKLIPVLRRIRISGPRDWKCCWWNSSWCRTDTCLEKKLLLELEKKSWMGMGACTILPSCLGEVVTCRSLGQAITCIYGSAVTFAFPNPYQWRIIDNRSLMPTWWAFLMGRKWTCAIRNFWEQKRATRYCSARSKTQNWLLWFLGSSYSAG